MKQDLRILVVDDEKPIVDTLLIYFERLGYNVTGYSDSVKAFEVLQTERFDIVFTDLKMPDVSGMDIVRQIKEQHNDTLVIIFTGYATTDSAIEAIQYGVYDYIRKPFKLDEIRVVLDRAIEKLLLRRENIALNRKIEKMLSQVTMLADITAILYQVDAFDEVSGMILDTLTEGLDISKVGIIGRNDKHEFSVFSHRNLPDSLVDNLNFTEHSNLNDSPITADQALILHEIFDKGLKVDGVSVWQEDSINEMIFVPIRYLDHIHGYILICDPENENFNHDDIIRLTTILSTHISPIFQTEKYDYSTKKSFSKTFDQLVVDMTSAEIDLAKKQSKSVTFVLYHLQNLIFLDQNVNVTDYGMRFKQRIMEEFEGKYDVLQQYYDSVLVIMPGANPLDIEFNSATIKQDIETMFKNEDSAAMFTVHYAAHTFIKSQDNALDILNELNRNILNQNVELPESI